MKVSICWTYASLFRIRSLPLTYVKETSWLLTVAVISTWPQPRLVHPFYIVCWKCWSCVRQWASKWELIPDPAKRESLHHSWNKKFPLFCPWHWVETVQSFWNVLSWAKDVSFVLPFGLRLWPLPCSSARLCVRTYLSRQPLQLICQASVFSATFPDW